jgi:hypothetical protein
MFLVGMRSCSDARLINAFPRVSPCSKEWLCIREKTLVTVLCGQILPGCSSHKGPIANETINEGDSDATLAWNTFLIIGSTFLTYKRGRVSE